MNEKQGSFRQYREVGDRIRKLRKTLMSAPTKICFERAAIVTRSYRESEGDHPAIRRAKAIRDVFEGMPIFLRENELIVGQRSEVLAGRSVYPEYNLDGLEKETTPPEIWEYWRGRCIADISARHFPERLRLVEEEKAAGYITGTGTGFGHVIVDYEKVLKKGFRSIIEEAEALRAAAPADDAEGIAFLQSVVIAAQGIIAWANRYADLALKEAGSVSDPVRKNELLNIAATCRRVPAEPARNYTEALQSFWFAHIAMHIEQYGWSISAGRFDQYVYPYFRQDIESGTITRDQAWELLQNLWIKFMENTHGRVGNTTFQNLTLGGQDLEGVDQSNELSWMCLDATVTLKFNQPALSARWHPGIDPAFWDKVHSTLSEGLGMPALFNDDIIVAALTRAGVAREDAVGYGLVGCVEASVPGAQMGMTAGGHLNCAKALELALNDGRSMITGRQIGLPVGDAAGFESFDDLWNAYKEQVEYLSGLNILASHIGGEIQKMYGYCPLMSSLLSDCLSARRDMVYGSTRYNLPGVAIFGPTNTCDGMSAIKKWVCDEKRLTWQELRSALLNDFKGREDLRLLLANRTPRFGNDLPEVDDLFNRINALHADFFWKQVDARNGRYTCGVWPVNSHLEAGRWTAATPDGRHSGMPLVDGVGACQGADRAGPTALLRSVAHIDNVKDWVAGNTCNIKLPASAVRSGDGVARMRDLVTAFMILGGQELQINVVDADTLKDAIKHPEKYSDLVVRVAGYSAYFTMLSPDIQMEILSRTEHSSL